MFALTKIRSRRLSIIVCLGSVKPVDSGSSGEHFPHTPLVHTEGDMVLLEVLDVLEDFTFSKWMAGAFTDDTFGRGRKLPGIGLDSMNSRRIAIRKVLVVGADVGWDIKARTIGESNRMDRCWPLSGERGRLGRKVTAWGKQGALGKGGTTVSKRARKEHGG